VAQHQKQLRQQGLDPHAPANKALTPLARDVAAAVASITLPILIERAAVHMDKLPVFAEPASDDTES